MSITDIPFSSSYYQPQPSITREYISPIKKTANFRNQSSPLLSGDPRALSNYYEKQSEIEARYQQDIERWKSKATESEYHQDLLEQENARLSEELQYWKTKNFSTEREQVLELQINQQMTSSQVHTFQKTAGNQQELLFVEIDSLRNQLGEKMREVDEQRKLYFDKEVKTQNARNATEAQLKAYEAQLKILLRDLQEKIDQADALQQENSTLQISASRLGQLQREVKEINSLLEYNYEETEKLRFELSKNQSENQRLRKNELALKDLEANLLQQVEQLQNRIRQTNQLRDSDISKAERSHLELLENLKHEHFKMKESLEQKKLNYSQLIAEKEKNVRDLSDNLEDIKDRIGRTKYRGSSAKKEAEEWRQKQKSIDQDREQEVSRIHKEREKSVEAVKRAHNLDRNQLEDRISNLRNDLNAKEELIKQTNQNLNRSRIEKSNLEIERKQLLEQMDQRLFAEKEQDRQHRYHLSAKERAYEVAQNNLRNSSQYERSKLQDQERVLTNVLDSKQRDAYEQQDRANRYRMEALDAERKSRERSIEADAWKMNYSRTERDKSLEVDAVRSLRQSQIEEMQRSHNASLLAEERNKSALIGELESKQHELRHLLDSNHSLVGELIVTQHEAKRAGLEAQGWRTRAEIEDRQRQQQLLQQEINQQSQLDSLRRTQNQENQFYKNKANNLLSSIEIKQNEESNWRQNYASLLGRR